MFLYDVPENEIWNIIDILENKSSSGFDNISNIILKRLKSAIVPPLTKIVKLILGHRSISWKDETCWYCPTL